MKAADLEAAKPGDTLKDDQVRGLQLRCFPNGKRWYLYYRTTTGQQRKPKIGIYPTMKLEQARSLARQLLAEVALGKDPSQQRAIDRSAETVSELCDRFITEHALTNKKPRSVMEDRRHIEQVIKPAWGNLRPSEVGVAQLNKLRRDNAKTPIRFNRCLALISKIWNFAKLPNISKEVAKYPEKARQRFLSDEELEAFAAALAKHEKKHPGAVAAIKLLLLTGARMSEIVRCRREWYHGDQLRLADHKTSSHSGMKIIHLSKEAQEIIGSLPQGTDYLCGISSRPTKVWNKIVADTGIADFKIHDLRRTFVSKGLDAGYSLQQLGKLVGHLSPATTNRYAFLEETTGQSTAASIAASISQRLKVDTKKPDEKGTAAANSKK